MKKNGHLLKVTTVAVIEKEKIVNYHKSVFELIHDPIQVAFSKYMQELKDTEKYKYNTKLFHIDIENMKLVEIKIPEIEIKG